MNNTMCSSKRNGETYLRDHEKHNVSQHPNDDHRWDVGLKLWHTYPNLHA